MEVYAAGAIVFDGEQRLLLVRRRHPPAAGRWTVPGGKVEPGESAEQACVRELSEETGLTLTVLHWVGRVQRSGTYGHSYVIDDFLCLTPTPAQSETIRAGDDAEDVGWFDLAALAGLKLVPELWETLERWQLLPR
jgi:8-oxo-dGTP diphosphatase